MNWNQFYFKRSLPLMESNIESLITAAYQTMDAANQAKVNKILGSPTWGDRWLQTIQATLAGLPGDKSPRRVAQVMLDGIDGYLRTAVTTNQAKSGRVDAGSMSRKMPPAPSTAINRGGMEKITTDQPSTLFSNPHASHGPVSPQEVAAKRLNPYHHDVWQGSMADAPDVYKYVYNKLNKKFLHNPNYRG